MMMFKKRRNKREDTSSSTDTALTAESSGSKFDFFANNNTDGSIITIDPGETDTSESKQDLSSSQRRDLFALTEQDRILETDNNASNNENKKKRSVSFGTVQIREYPMIVGDHPDTQEGPPLTIAWDYCDESTVPVDEYEQTNPSSRRGKESEIRVLWFQRMTMLRELGFSEPELSWGIKESRKVQLERYQTYKYSERHEKVEEIHQSFGQLFGRILNPRKMFPLKTKY